MQHPPFGRLQALLETADGAAERSAASSSATAAGAGRFGIKSDVPSAPTLQGVPHRRARFAPPDAAVGGSLNASFFGRPPAAVHDVVPKMAGLVALEARELQAR